MNSNFLGTAMAFPMRPNGRGGLALVSGIDAVEDSLRALIVAMKGSHLFEPWMGLPSFVFKPISDVYLIAELIKDAIVDGDSRVDPASLRVEVSFADADDGQMQVAVSYSILGQATVRTLQHGFRTID